MAAASKTLVHRPELACELIDLGAGMIRKLATGELEKDQYTAYNYALTNIYRLLPYLVSPNLQIPNPFEGGGDAMEDNM